MGGKCGSKKLCPISFGLALGITAGLATFLWLLWTMHYGPSSMMLEYHIPVPSFKDGSLHAFWALVKGFVFGFFVALFYDLISCCCRKKRCCNKDCECCAPENKPDVIKKY